MIKSVVSGFLSFVMINFNKNCKEQTDQQRKQSEFDTEVRDRGWGYLHRSAPDLVVVELVVPFDLGEDIFFEGNEAG